MEVSVLDIITKGATSDFGLHLACQAGRKGMHKQVIQTINRPGLALNMVFFEFGEHRIQLFGKGEHEFIHELDRQNKLHNFLEEFFTHSIPCCIFTHTNEKKPPQLMIEKCEKYDCPLLYSEKTTADVYAGLFRVMNDLFAPTIVEHGVFLEVYDLGILIQGDSGIGKSEVALELLDKGKYRLVADDAVLFKKMNDHTIIGSSMNVAEGNRQYQYNLEIRGLGLVNISQIYGVGTILDREKLNVVIDLQPWDDDKVHDDRLVEKNEFIDILGVPIPYYLLHLKTGRNMSLLIETAARKHRLTTMGFHGKENPYLW